MRLRQYMVECSRFEGIDGVGEGACHWFVLSRTIFNMNEDDSMGSGNADDCVG